MLVSHHLSERLQGKGLVQSAALGWLWWIVSTVPRRGPLIRLSGLSITGDGARDRYISHSMSFVMVEIPACEASWRGGESLGTYLPSCPAVILLQNGTNIRHESRNYYLSLGSPKVGPTDYTTSRDKCPRKLPSMRMQLWQRSSSRPSWLYSLEVKKNPRDM